MSLEHFSELNKRRALIHRMQHVAGLLKDAMLDQRLVMNEMAMFDTEVYLALPQGMEHLMQVAVDDYSKWGPHAVVYENIDGASVVRQYWSQYCLLVQLLAHDVLGTDPVVTQKVA